MKNLMLTLSLTCFGASLICASLAYGSERATQVDQQHGQQQTNNSSAKTKPAAKQKNIRFYKLNKKDQQNRVLIRSKKTQQTGCFNFLRKPRVYRVTQIGFTHCRLYAAKNCAAESAIPGQWKNETPTVDLTQGGQWLFNADHARGTKAKSWFCE